MLLARRRRYETYTSMAAPVHAALTAVQQALGPGGRPWPDVAKEADARLAGPLRRYALLLHNTGPHGAAPGGEEQRGEGAAGQGGDGGHHGQAGREGELEGGRFAGRRVGGARTRSQVWWESAWPYRRL